MDADDYIYLVDRVKDMINSAGFKIWPREVEEVLFEHPAIRECAVVGLPDPEKGEITAVFLVLRDGHDAGPEALGAFCRKALAAFKVPQEFRLMRRDDLPVTATGKVQKFRLAELLGGERGGASA